MFNRISQCFISVVFTLLCVLLVASCSNSEYDLQVFVVGQRPAYSNVIKAYEAAEKINILTTYVSKSELSSTLLNTEKSKQRSTIPNVLITDNLLELASLKSEGVVEAYRSPRAAALIKPFNTLFPDMAAFAASIQVIIANENSAPADEEMSVQSFTQPAWKGKAAIVGPSDYRSGSFFAGFLSRVDAAAFVNWLSAMKQNDVAVVENEEQLRDRVAAGEFAFGLLSSDVAYAAKDSGLPIKVILPDQAAAGLGTYLLPNFAVPLAGGPSSDIAEGFIDFLYSPEAQQLLAEGSLNLLPLRIGEQGPPGMEDNSKVRLMAVDYKKLKEHQEAAVAELRKLWPE